MSGKPSKEEFDLMRKKLEEDLLRGHFRGNELKLVISLLLLVSVTVAALMLADPMLTDIPQMLLLYMGTMIVCSLISSMRQTPITMAEDKQNKHVLKAFAVSITLVIVAPMICLYTDSQLILILMIILAEIGALITVGRYVLWAYRNYRESKMKLKTINT